MPPIKGGKGRESLRLDAPARMWRLEVTIASHAGLRHGQLRQQHGLRRQPCERGRVRGALGQGLL